MPDQVLFGLILGNIRGPPKYLPKIYAIVSLKKEIKKIKKNIFLSMLFMKKSIMKNIYNIKTNNSFLYFLIDIIAITSINCKKNKFSNKW